MGGGYFRFLSQADEVKFVVGLVCCADRSDGVRTVELIIGHIVDGSQLTAKSVKAIDSNVNNSLRLLYEISAHNVPPVIGINFISDSNEITVSVLS